MTGAKGILINIAGGADLTLYEVDEAANRIRREVDPEANIIFGASFDASLEGSVPIRSLKAGSRFRRRDGYFASAGNGKSVLTTDVFRLYGDTFGLVHVGFCETGSDFFRNGSPTARHV